MSSQSPPHPGVHFPPPLFYIVGLLVGWALHRQRPFAITDGPSAVRQIAAALLISVCAILVFSAIAAFRRARTTVLPNRPANSLVTNGPYRYTRNPMYVSFAILYVAATLIMNTVWPLLVLPLVILAIDRVVIAREERYLSSAFPGEYYAYRRRVRRWL